MEKVTVTKIEYWQTIHYNKNFQVSNFGRIRPTIKTNQSEHNYKSRLFYQQVILARHLAREHNVSNKSLAKMFDMTHAGMCNIISKRRWKDV